MALGMLDRSFGAGGGVLLPLPGASACAVAVDASDRTVIAGNVVGVDHHDDHIVLARLTRDGQLDKAFGGGGILRMPQYPGCRCSGAILSQPDGSLALIATAQGAAPVSWLVSIDPRGHVLGSSQREPVGPPQGAPRPWLRLSVLASANYGHVVAAGATGHGTHRRSFVAVRLDRSGGLDPSFGEGGVVMTDFGDQRFEVASVLVHVDSTVLAVGTMTDGRHFHPAMVRYLGDGSLDTSFGTGGLSLGDFGGDQDRALTGCLLPAGRILIAGSTTSGSGERPTFAAYRRDGSPEPDFGHRARGHESLSELEGSFTAIALDAAGNAVLAGRLSRGQVDGVGLTRLTQHGGLDPATGVGGVLVTQLRGRSRAVGVALDTTGAILVAAETETADGLVALRYVLPATGSAAQKGVPYLTRSELEARQDELAQRLRHEHDMNTMITRGITW